MRQQHACVHRTPQSSTDHFQQSASKKRQIFKVRKLSPFGGESYYSVISLFASGFTIAPTVIDWDQTINTRRIDTHINYHFTALARSYLCKDLQNERFGYIPGQVPHIPTSKNRDDRNWGFVKQEVACKQRLRNQLATIRNDWLVLLT